MKRILCFFVGHKWKILSKTKLSEIAEKMSKTYWWASKSFHVKRYEDFDLINRQCLRCGKFDNNIDEAKKLVRTKILN